MLWGNYMFKYDVNVLGKSRGFWQKGGAMGNSGKAVETAWEAAVLPLNYARASRALIVQ